MTYGYNDEPFDGYQPCMPDLRYHVEKIGDHKYMVYIDDHMRDFIAVFFTEQDAQKFADQQNAEIVANVKMIREIGFEAWLILQSSTPK